MSYDRRDDSVIRNESFSDAGNISTGELENLIGVLLLDDDADYKFLSELLDVYENREGVPGIDVDAVWEVFKRDYMGQGEIYLTDDTDNPAQTNKRERMERVKHIFIQSQRNRTSHNDE